MKSVELDEAEAELFKELSNIQMVVLWRAGKIHSREFTMDEGFVQAVVKQNGLAGRLDYNYVK